MDPEFNVIELSFGISKIFFNPESAKKISVTTIFPSSTNTSTEALSTNTRTLTTSPIAYGDSCLFANSSSKSTLPAQEASETFKEKEGNSADIAVLFHQMLKTAKINSDFAFIRSRYLGEFPKKVPMIDWFDKLILMITNENDTIWIDPYYRTAKFGTLPNQVQGVDALVFNNKNE